MATVKVVAEQIAELGGASNLGTKLGFIDSAEYATQNDTLTVTNAVGVQFAEFTTDADGVANVVSGISTNVITLSSATATAVSGLIVYT